MTEWQQLKWTLFSNWNKHASRDNSHTSEQCHNITLVVLLFFATADVFSLRKLSFGMMMMIKSQFPGASASFCSLKTSWDGNFNTVASLTSRSSPVADWMLQWLTIASHGHLCKTTHRRLGHDAQRVLNFQVESKFAIRLMKARYIGWRCPVILPVSY